MLKYVFCEMVRTYIQEGADVEERLKEIGYDMGKRMILFQKFKQESSLDALMYKLVYIFLPYFYEADRKLEKSEEKETYLIIENNPLFNKYISLPNEYIDFSCDSIIAGAIESVTMASGFSTEVVVYNSPTPEFPDRIIFVVKCNTNDSKVIEL